MSIQIHGIRHHGPGSARSLLRALEVLCPDVVLIEGPPDADPLIALAGDAALKPPVALLVYDPETPRRSAFFPFAEFSPEWQAIRFALERQIPVRFMDLPQACELALMKSAETEESAEGGARSAENGDGELMRGDPLALLARAAGYEDSERWWEHLVEERRESGGLFEAIREAMTALRTELAGSPAACADEREARREAWMRQTIRAAEKDGFEKIAVVCGAWHAPALGTMPPARQDAALLKGLPRLKVQATWIPWTYGRLARDCGYRAGVGSPGWYDFLWRFGHADGNALAVQWLTRVARLLRGRDLDVSTAHVIEAVRLAEALAAMRGRPGAGLPELGDATLAVILNGEAAPLRLIERELIVGERLGQVPEGVPAVPLQRDLQALQKALRLPPAADSKDYDLDLRKPNDLERSRLLHRLRLLGIGWGAIRGAGVRAKGTFHESWRLQWQPEFAVALIEAAVWGNTVAAAATAFAMHRAAEARTLAGLTGLIDAVLLAELPEAVAFVMARLEAEAALASDVGQMMEALPPLAAVARYGNVRGADAGLVGRVVEGLVTRISVGLGEACASLDDEAAGSMFGRIVNVESAVLTLENAALRAVWREALARLAGREGLHGTIAGRACRILFDGGELDAEDAACRMERALSRGADPLQAGAWLEGFLRGSGMLLLHTAALWAMIDAWLNGLGEEAFMAVLPLLRRTFASFPAPERRMMGERAGRGGTAVVALVATAAGADGEEEMDMTRAGRPLAMLKMLLGIGDQ